MRRHYADPIDAARIEFRKTEESRKTAIVYLHSAKKDYTVRININFMADIKVEELSWIGYYRRQGRFKYSDINNLILPIYPLGEKLERLVSLAFSQVSKK